jgi:hypothetical protein
MDKEIRLRVAGLKDEEQAHRVEAVLHSKVGVQEVEASAESGVLRLRYDTSRVPQLRLQAYLKEAGVRSLGDADT